MGALVCCCEFRSMCSCRSCCEPSVHATFTWHQMWGGGEMKPGQLRMHMRHCGTDPIKAKAFTYNHTHSEKTHMRPVRRETLIIRKLQIDRHEASVFWAGLEEDVDLSISVCKAIPESSWPLASFICSWSPECGRVYCTLTDLWTHNNTMNQHTNTHVWAAL